MTRGAPGNIKRLSVAVLMKEEPGKPRGQVEIKQIDDLVKATVGFNPARQDQVTVVSPQVQHLARRLRFEMRKQHGGDLVQCGEHHLWPGRQRSQLHQRQDPAR